MRIIKVLFAIATTLLATLCPAGAAEPYRIEVVEKGSGWPVPLVELRTTNSMRFVSDNAGVVAFDAPELMGRETWFEVVGNGYEVARDGFGLRGVRLTPKAGATLRVEVTRTIVARRIGRITGGGIFGESQKTGRDAEWREPGILGCDSVQCALHRGRQFWLWGDTTLAHYPLGIFDSTGAWSAPKPLEKWEPPLKMQLDLIKDVKGASRGIAPISGEGPTWITAVASLPDSKGEARLVGTYMKIKPPLDIYEWGLCVWDDATNKFERSRVLWTKSEKAPKPPELIPEGHAAFWKDADGKQWLLFGNPLPRFRCEPTFEAWSDPARWEKLAPQGNIASADGKKITPHTGSIAWHPWRKRWVTVFMESQGKPSTFGELWYAESDSPTGKWGPAVKVLSHENYTFYNPRLHAEFTPDGSPMLLFEGTYTQQFANRPTPTPRYDYNQILYRLDLDDPALRPAQTK